MPGEAETGQEGARLGQAATQAGEGFDAVAGFGGGANRRGGEIVFDEVVEGGEVAHGSGDTAVSQPVEAAFAVGGEVALHGGPPASGDGGGLMACHSAVREPEHEHLAPHDRIGMGLAFGGDDGLFGFGQNDGRSSHPWHSGTNGGIGEGVVDHIHRLIRKVSFIAGQGIVPGFGLAV